MVATLAAFPARPSSRPHAGPAASRRYQRRRPEETPLYKIVSECLEGWLGDRSAREHPVAGSIEEEFRGYLTCGLLCFGFARALCTRCPQRFVVAFSCKRRGVCPSCNGRHMAQTAAHLVDHVIPPVPVRQWVISLPKRLRGVLGDRPKALAAVSRIFLAEIEKLLCLERLRCSNHATLPSPRPRVGAVSFLHRFGSGLNRHAHLHAAVTDGVFLPGPHGPDGPPAFLPARPLTQPGASGVIELSPFEFLAPAYGSHPTAAEAPASLSRSVCAEPPAAAGRHGSGGKGMSGSSAMPRRAGMRATTTPREAVVTRTKSLAPTTPPGSPGPS